MFYDFKSIPLDGFLILIFIGIVEISNFVFFCVFFSGLKCKTLIKNMFIMEVVDYEGKSSETYQKWY